MEIEFSFDPNQKPIFKAGQAFEDANKHRPTFLGNSGIGIYHWPGNAEGKYLYEVQVTDVSGMSEGVRSILHKNRFLRLNYGANWDQRGVWAMLDPLPAVEDLILAIEKSKFNARDDAPFNAAIENGGADSICAFVAGLPVSYFKDVKLGAGAQTFPKPAIAVTSPVPEGANLTPALPIGGVEDPRDMYWGNRADYVTGTGAEVYQHFNHLDSSAWNTLKICFLSARYLGENKCRNAYLKTQVNAAESYGGGFDGAIKSGTRTSRRRQGVNPESDIYVGDQGDKRIRLLGHWGSTVKFRNVTIRSVGSVE